MPQQLDVMWKSGLCRTSRKHLHWEKIVHSACEQSGRNFVPQVTQVQGFDTWIKGKQGCKLILDPRSEQSLQQLECTNEHVILLSGPEGGFTEEERLKAISTGFQPLRLGPRILRTETAVLAAIAAIQTLWGDLG